MEAVTDSPDSKQEHNLLEFLEFLFKGLEGYIYCPVLDREIDEFQPVFVKTTQLPRLIKFIEDKSPTTDVYLAPAVFSEPRVSKATFLASKVVWCEFDGNEPHKYDPWPSARIRSSINGHTHVYWLLDEPIDSATDLENINRALAFTYEADKSGWDCTQILRPPFTTNHKRGLPVTIRELNPTAVFNLGDFVKFKAPDRLDETTFTLGHIPDVMDVIYKYALGTDFKELFTVPSAVGTRSTSIMRVGYLAAEAGCTDEEIYALLVNYDDRTGKYKTRQDRQRRLVDIIERVRAKVPLPSEETKNDFEIEIYDVVSFNDLDIKVDWVLPGLLHEKGCMVLSGPPGVGKSTVSLNFAYALTTGQPILDYQIDRPRRILFISAEMEPTELKYFTEKIGVAYKPYEKLLREAFYVYPLGQSMPLNNKTEQEKLIRMIDVLRLDGVIIDSLGSASSESLSKEESAKSLLDFNDKIRSELGVFTWYIHHLRKASEGNKEPSSLEDIYGSQYIGARASAAVNLWPVDDKTLKVREVKIRLAKKNPDWYIERDSSNLSLKRVSAPTPMVIEKRQTTIGKAANDGPSNPFKI